MTLTYTTNTMPAGDCTPDEARALTEQIRSATDALWQLLAEAHRRRAWAALVDARTGAQYASFRAYVSGEFGMSRSRAYQLLDQATVIAALSVQDPGHSHINAEQAAALAPLKDEPLLVRAAFDAGEQLAEAAGRRPTANDMREAVAIVENVTATAETDDATELAVVIKQAVAENIESKRVPVSKPDLGGGVSHPARYTDTLLPVFADIITAHFGDDIIEVLDPFAGTGKIHQLAELRPNTETHGIELEPEWAALHPNTMVGDALALPYEPGEFDVVCTSPTYGNRLADKHQAADPHLRRSYTHDLGRPLTDNNSGGMQWGDTYRTFHIDAWTEALRALRPGGLLIVNIKDHIRDGQLQLVSMWHTATIVQLGATYLPELSCAIGTPSLRAGANSAARVDHEYVLVFTKEGNR